MLGIDYLWGAKAKPLQISDSVVFILTSLAHHSVKFRRHLSTRRWRRGRDLNSRWASDP
jgi:hypothetical protein